MAKTKPDSPIEALTAQEIDTLYCRGLTKREYFSIKAMQGLLAEGDISARTTDEGVASMSVDLADALIEQLNEK